jgi:hypothetical protein
VIDLTGGEEEREKAARLINEAIASLPGRGCRGAPIIELDPPSPSTSTHHSDDEVNYLPIPLSLIPLPHSSLCVFIPVVFFFIPLSL